MIVLFLPSVVFCYSGWDSRIRATLYIIHFSVELVLSLGGLGGEKSFLADGPVCVLFSAVSVLLRFRLAFCLAVCCASMRPALGSFFIWVLSLAIDCYYQMKSTFPVVDALLPNSSSGKKFSQVDLSQNLEDSLPTFSSVWTIITRCRIRWLSKFISMFKIQGIL